MTDFLSKLDKIENPSFTKNDVLEKLKNLPENIQGFNRRIAGHENALFQDKNSSKLYKPVFDCRGVREELFYKLIFSSNYENNEKIQKLKSFLPTYFGTEIINEVQFITLNDITYNIENPSLMDIKLGVVTYDRNASPEKITKELSKNMINKEFGFRILAVKKWVPEKNDYEMRERDYCRNCKISEETEIINFFLDHDKDKKEILVKSFLEQLNEIKNWFENENVNFLEFLGSSLLFMYSFDKDFDTNKKVNCCIKMIDFAHVFQLEGSIINSSDDKKDNNYLCGLKKLISSIENVL